MASIIFFKKSISPVITKKCFTAIQILFPHHSKAVCTFPLNSNLFNKSEECNCSIFHEHKILDEMKLNFSTNRELYNGMNVFRKTGPLLMDPTREKNIPLMAFRKIIWPNFANNLRVITLSNLVVVPFIDPYFRKKSFLNEAKIIVLKVSKLLSVGDTDSLNRFVTNDAIEEIKLNINRLSSTQLEELFVIPENIVFSFIYSLDVIIDRNQKPLKKLVRIICCFHSFAGTQDAQIVKMKRLLRHPERHRICNYRFVRDYTKNVADSKWMVDKLNHFKGADIPSRILRKKIF